MSSGHTDPLLSPRRQREMPFNVLEIKNPQGLRQDPEDCTRFFILTCSPALEGTLVNFPGRSSGSWFVLLPVPSHPSDRTVALAGFVPIHSGGTARDSHPLPLSGNYNVSGNSRRHEQFLSSSLLCENLFSYDTRSRGGSSKSLKQRGFLLLVAA
jgi:hypothetical protein